MREAPYIILILLIIVAASLFLGNSDPIPVATGQAEANALLSEIPAGGWIANKFMGTLFSIILSGVVLGIAGVFIAQGRKWLRDRQYTQKWKGGPNAQWNEKAPKQPKMDANQMLQLAMLEKLTPLSSKTPTTTPPYILSQQPQPEESLDLRF